MRYVLIRDDDTNALTPAAYLERLYVPFLDRGMPVNLATIPNVRTDVTYGGGIPEGFLVARKGDEPELVSIAANAGLTEYLKTRGGYQILQHGCRHEFVSGACEFEINDRADVVRRIDEGRAHMREAGFGDPQTFVAPYDRFTPASLWEVARRFALVSMNWFEWSRIPMRWLPRYAMKKLGRRPHWRVGATVLMSHTGCLLSYHHPPGEILDQIRRVIGGSRVTVLVTHWWEYFRGKVPDERLIGVLHETAEMLAGTPNLRVVRFADVISGAVPID